MKILFPLQVFYPSQAGGPANSIHWLTKNLRQQGFEPVVVATDQGIPSDVPLNKWIENEDGRVIFIKTRSLRVPIRAAIRSLRSIGDVDVVHLSSFFFPTAFITAFAASLLKKKL